MKTETSGMTNKGESDYEKLDHGTHKIVSDVQLRKYGKFLEEYGSQLQSVEEALEDYVCDAWDMTLDPLSLQFAAYEDSEILELLVSDNKVVTKVLKVFSTLCCEVDFLTKEAWAKFFDTILYYGEGSEEESKPDGESQIKMAQLLPQIHAIWCWVKRAGVVCEHVICQLNALYSARREKRRLFGGSDLHFQDVLEHLSDLLVTLITFDEIFHAQDTLRNHWRLFRRMLKSVKHDASSVGIVPEKLQDLDDLLSNYETDLFSGAIFQTALHQMVSSVSKKHVSEELTGFVQSALGELEGRPVEVQDADHLLRWVKLSALFALHVNLTGSVDKKMMRQLWDFHKKIPSVTLYANVVWFPEKFLATVPQLAKFVDKKAEQQVTNSRITYLQTKNVSLSKEVHSYDLQVCCWMVQLETALKKESVELKTDDLNQLSSLLLQGVQLACAMGRLVRTRMNLHVALERPMSRSSVILLCRLIELLQGIKSLYHRHSVRIAQSTAHIVQHNLYQVLTIINSVKKNHVQNRRSSERYADVLSALELLENALNGPMTRERRLVARLSLSIASQGKSFRDEDHVSVLRLLRRLDAICDLQARLFAACDCSFLYWHRVILSTYFSGLYENKTALHRLSYMVYALKDCVVTMHRDANNAGLENTFEKEVTAALQKQILRPLCHEIETSLRLSVHSHLQLDERNPFTTYLPDFAPLVKLRPMRFFDNYIDIKGFVEHHLDQTFYNLTTVALHDWRTYGEMRSLAKHKYSLETVEDHLPSQTLEQGLDVLEIMRNIHIFVSKYLYNLNNQIFIEQSSNNKHLNTINIRHVANSIRTHGTGIMNTTVNFTYQFLRKKFFIFSQFMFDEHIKSRLLKDLRFFRENKTNLEQKYSFERAHKFNRGIRKLGVTPQGDSYLDQFRVLISQIGNAMGYVRMIRSGGLHCCSNAICFVPDLEDVANFESLCVDQGLSESCRSAARHLDQVIGNLGRNFAEGTEYFKLLVNVFQTEFNKVENIHLRNFHAIVPPLTINFVEHSIMCKEQLNKKNKNNAAFTDDGFAMGVAYILTVLGLQGEWDAIHWFDSVRAKYAKDKATLNSQRQTVKAVEDENLQHTMTLTGRRLEMYQQEFDLLYYSLSSARIFFQKEEKSVSSEASQIQETPVS